MASEAFFRKVLIGTGRDSCSCNLNSQHLYEIFLFFELRKDSLPISKVTIKIWHLGEYYAFVETETEKKLNNF